MNRTLNRFGFLAATFILVAVLASLVPIVVFAMGQGGRVAFDGYIWSVLRFTLLQASISTIVSILVALPAALALANQKFIGRELMLAMFAVPQMLPAIVVVLALTGVFGTAGWIPNLLNLYSLSGIVLAHAFFNVPLCIRLFTQALEAVQPENHALAAQLGLNSWNTWQHVHWPILKTILPRIAALVFLYCAASFVVVLTFGGPAATTLEVAIYQSLRLDFDVARAITLSTIQIVLCLVLVFFAGSSAQTIGVAKPLRQSNFINLQRSFGLQHYIALVLPLLLVLPPLVHLIIKGVAAIEFRPILAQAAFTSIVLAFVSSLITFAIGWALAAIAARKLRYSTIYATIAIMGMVVPPAVLATGWFILLRQMPANVLLSAGLMCLLNALMALPLVFSILTNAMINRTASYDQLCAQLNITGFTRFLQIDFPAMQSAIFQALLIAAVLSLGDLTAVMLLGSNGIVTMPSLIASEMGNYRGTSAQGTAFLLAIGCFALALTAARLSEKENSEQ